MVAKQIDILEKLLSEKVSEERTEEYEKYQKINGASEEELNALEKRYNIKLPKDFREFYKYKNGSGYHFHILYPNCECEHIEPFYLFSIEEIIEEKDGFYDDDELMSDYYDEEEISELDCRIKPYLKNRNWIPFAALAGGSLNLLLDYDPTDRGKEGQIISYIHDPDFIYYVANTFTEMLEKSNINLSNWDKIDY
ncbi:SMI1/KNR4 family protein [Clostridium sp. OS1-26]|uniref:SMI1/KNR4 family protein n=1 Tax=Clostridium sp. OS1-26 TaxID=3070681 RepID=UPI0027E199BD|nr:SMI1/KNR4 family protein [Clostridium sp. OS1-26]WML32996.1 SMI1/KNR4 family protein [Clostridium sp. OS1-26]